MSETLKAISDPVRRDILNMLKEERKSAGEIAERFNLTGATVSYHLSQLKKADLVTESKYKNFIYYEILQLGFLFQLLFVFITQRKEILTNGKCNKRNETDKLEKRNIY